ncbi:TetR/AcrR family transcriptional regulator [Microbacterium sp.]|uniref:TetR/AcrR family transcriptional regulator n=1 Tax=Microbacterium sp. TaxID=51671 RepID=UPI003C753523
MAPHEAQPKSARQERRKAATRAKIQTAAEQLFAQKGYAATSIDDISVAADVAMRTIYVHFPSKAAIMLAYFDDWMDAFIAEILRRPVDEPVVTTVREALAAMNEAGWVDRVENDDIRVHPLVEHLDSGAPAIAGHVLQRWMHEVARIAADTRARGDVPDASLTPQARGVAVFAAWIGAMTAARSRERGEPLSASGSGNGLDILTALTGGGL